jgi:hypothetical protein
VDNLWFRFRILIAVTSIRYECSLATIRQNLRYGFLSVVSSDYSDNLQNGITQLRKGVSVEFAWPVLPMMPTTVSQHSGGKGSTMWWPPNCCALCGGQPPCHSTLEVREARFGGHRTVVLGVVARKGRMRWWRLESHQTLQYRHGVQLAMADEGLSLDLNRRLGL